MLKRTLAATTLLIALVTIGCSNYVMAPEEPRGDLEIGLTQPPTKIDGVKDGGFDLPRRVYEPQAS
jgi:hypothetical protein